MITGLFFMTREAPVYTPRVDKKFLTIEQNLDDLHSIVEHFSNGKKVENSSGIHGQLLWLLGIYQSILKWFRRQ